MTPLRIEGLVAATYTPMHADGRINLSVISDLVEFILQQGVKGLYVCGSTGEGVSLTGKERRSVAGAFVQAAQGRVPVIVQVGHNSLVEARELAAHAATIGANAISATPPAYFPVPTVERLVACMAKVAAGAPELPFYYYHIPAMTGVALDMAGFLTDASGVIPNLAGIKFTDPRIQEYQACLSAADGKYEILWGHDEMLLAALSVGAIGAVGSTYNVAAPLYRALIDAFRRGDLLAARRAQWRSVELIEEANEYGFHPAMKATLGFFGVDCGPCRLPLGQLDPDALSAWKMSLEGIGFFDWAIKPDPTITSPGT